MGGSGSRYSELGSWRFKDRERRIGHAFGRRPSPPDLLEKLDRLSDAEGLDRSTVIRQLLERGYDAFMRERAADRYRRGEVTLSEAADLAECTVWEFERYLVGDGYSSSYSIDDLEREREAMARRRESSATHD